MSKILYVDVETTGLDETKHSIVQCSGIIEIDDKVEETFDLNICPRKGTAGDPEALEIIGKTREQLLEYPSASVQYDALCAIFGKYVNKFDRKDKFFFAGYNANFDMKFMRAWWEAANDIYFGSWFYFPPLDIMTIAANELMAWRADMEDFKLPTVCKFLKIPWDEVEAHDAMYDIEKAMEVHNALEDWPEREFDVAD